MIESPVRETPAEIRRRLLYPVNGRISSELDIIAVPAARRLKLERLAEEAAREALEAEVRRREEDRALAAAAAQRAREELERWVSAQRTQALNLGDIAPPRISMGRVIAEVCIRYQVEEIDLCSDRRTANVVLPRQIAMYLCRTFTLKSLPEIGRRLGGKDHTTVLHGVRKITRLVENYPHLAAEIEDIKKALEAE
jgi:chromosomal replication initiation ATPase DnaA